MARVTFQKSCGAVLAHLGDDQELRFLLLHSGLVRNPKAQWEFPKGSVEAGESDRETARRECQEETGISDLVFLDAFRALDAYEFHRQGVRIRKRVVYFVGLIRDPADLKSGPDGREHTFDDQGLWAQWLPFEQARKVLHHGGQRGILAAAYAHLSALGYTEPDRVRQLFL